MISRNDTPFAAIGFGQVHRDGPRMAVICVRATYLLGATGFLDLANAQDNYLSDIYESDPHLTPLVKVGDLIPYKPFTDVTFLGNAYAPKGTPASGWDVSISINDHLAELNVHGPRMWVPALHFLRPGWKLSAAEAVDRVPLDYRLAAGGRLAGDPNNGYDARNPLGSGILTEHSALGIALRAAQIDNCEALVIDAFRAPEPKGFGPVPPWWLSRERFAGTRDGTWQRERHPYLPNDFDYRFYQTANADLVVPCLAGDETICLKGLVPGGGKLAFSLPGIVPVAVHEWLDGRRANSRLRLDGVHLDLRADKGPWHVDLTWRGWIATCPTYKSAAIATLTIADSVGLPTSDENGLAEAA